MAIPTVDEVWADFNLDGTVKEPAKQDIRRLLRFIQALAEASGMKTYPNKAAMDADLTQEDGQPALLYADPVEANNYPTVWVWDDAGNEWIDGVDRITPVKVTADAAMAIAGPLADATNILMGNILELVGGLKFFGFTLRSDPTHPIYDWAIVTTTNRVFLAGRKDGFYELLGVKFDFTTSPYPLAILNRFGKMLMGIGPDGYPVGGLNPQQTEEVEAIADASGANDPSQLSPVYLGTDDKVYEAGPAGPSLVIGLDAPYKFLYRADKRAGRIYSITDRPYISNVVTAVAIHRSLKYTVPSAEEILFIIPVIGQSLSVGVLGTPLTLGLTNPHPEHILKVEGLDVRLGLMSDGVADDLLNPATIADFDPLISMSGVAGPVLGLTVSEGMGPGIVSECFDNMHGFRPRCLFLNVGRSGIGYSGLKKGTNAYTNLIAAITKICTVARAKLYVPYVPGVILVHGETDAASATYYADLLEWQTDIDTDVRPLTGLAGVGQARTIPFIMNMHSSFLAGQIQSVLAQGKAMDDFPDRFTVACPNYQLKPHYVDGVHFNGQGYHDLGRLYLAKALMKQVFGGGWTPLWPDRAEVDWDGTTLTVPFKIPQGTVSIDTSIVTDPGHMGYTALDGAGALPISSAALVGGGTAAQFTFGRAVSTAPKVRAGLVGYAATPRVDNYATMPRTVLRDGGGNWLPHHEVQFA
ncbi:hypothetical protein [Inquilinus sp. CA228]|uniref:hypothetical protein n=1 Tax=Inquilinus sp. CA228 TaxID=3455609 RepID=UPI003F8D2784